MPPEKEGGESVGQQLAIEMLEAIREANKNSAATREVMIELRDLMEEDGKVRAALLEATDELCGRLEILSVASDILTDVAGNGSKRLDLADFVNAIHQATTDVFPDEDEEDGDDEGGDQDTDPVVSGGGRKRGRRNS